MDTKDLDGLATRQSMTWQECVRESRGGVDWSLLAKYGLSPRQRECITLHYRDGMSSYKIAKKLKINQSVVVRHIKRGKDKMRDSWADCLRGRE